MPVASGPPRQCGRCRQSFPADPTLHPDALPEWWLCPPCRTALLGGGRQPAPATGRAPERSQLVWGQARELARPGAGGDEQEHATTLLRTAHNDPATMAHGLTLGRTHLLAEPGDTVARAAAGILERAIAFLGAKPTADDAAQEAGG